MITHKYKKHLIHIFNPDTQKDSFEWFAWTTICWLGLVDRYVCKNITTSLMFCNLAPWALNCFLQRNLFITTPTPSWGPFPWPILKKLQHILQPPVIFNTMIQITMVYYSLIGVHNHHSTPLMPLWGNMSIVYHVLLMQFRTMLNKFKIMFSIIRDVEWYSIRICEYSSHISSVGLWWKQICTKINI